MWKVIRDLGNDEQLIQCPECGYQMIADEVLPEACPNCGEFMLEDEIQYEPRNIDINRSGIDLRDEEEVPVVEYERDTPLYKRWYFWLILVLSIVLLVAGLYIAKIFLWDNRGADSVSTQTNVGGVQMTVPSGWASENGIYFSPGGANTLEVYSKDVSRWLKTEDVADLVYELSGSETNDNSTSKGIQGRLLTKTVEDTNENGEVVTTLIERYVFVYKSKLYMITYRSNENDKETFNSIIDSITMGS